MSERVSFQLGMLALLVGWLCCPSTVYAQPPEDRSATEATPTPTVRVVERGPEVIYAVDENGKRVPLINLTFAEIERLLDADSENAEQREPPKYQLERIQVRGDAADTRATLMLTVELTTVLDADRDEGDQWVSVPLRMHESSLLETPEYVGDGELLVSHDEQEGYQAWIKYSKPGKHRITLRFSTNLSRAALATQMRFFPPAANISSLELNVPGERVTAEIQNGRDLKISPSAESRSIISASDLRNQVIVVWRDGVETRDDKAAYLDARGDIQVSIDGPGAIRSDVVLDVKSYSEPIESFQLRLPPRTTIVSSTDQGYRISELNRPTPNDNSERRTAQVTLDKPGTEIQLVFSTQTTGAGSNEDAATNRFNVANFEVLGALRQSGRVTLMSSEDWLVYWDLGPSVRRVLAADDPSDRQDRKRIASFEYFRQPCRLQVEIKPQSTRVSVEPTYRLKVEEDRVSLEVLLRYTIRGARSSFLNFDLNGWELDDVGPSSTVENDHFQDGPDSKVKLRLTQPRTGEFELVLNLHRPVTEPSGTLRFPLPWPTYDSISPGILIVNAADAVVLNYRLDEMVGLAQDTIPPEFVTTQSTETQPPAAFRFRNDRFPGDVVMDYEVRDREIRVRADAVMEISAETADVSQRFTYRVLYEPASRLSIAVPNELYRLLVNPRYRSVIELELNNEMLSIDDLLTAGTGVDEGARVVTVDIPLEQPALGTIDLMLRYPWRINSGRSQFSSIPLAMPAEGELLANTARLTTRGPLQVELSAEAIWEEDEGAVFNEAAPGIALAAEFPTNTLPFRVTKQQESSYADSPRGATEVSVAWMQTWLAQAARQDRIVYRITSGAATVYLPIAPPEDGSVVLIVDGVKNSPQWVDADEGKELEIRLPRNEEDEHTIELAISYNSRSPSGAMSFEFPRFRDAPAARRWFWQLLLPTDEHLLLADQRLTSSNRWERRGWLWHRTGSNTQPELEEWTAATRQPEVPSSVNQYLFSSIDPVDAIQVRTSPRRLLVYSASAAVLVFGLALIYIPLLRHPLILLLVALGLVVGASLFPSASVILAQASLLGSLLVVLSLLIAAVVRWLQSRRMQLHSAARQSDSRSDIQISWRESGSNSTTKSAPVPSLPVADSKA